MYRYPDGSIHASLPRFVEMDDQLRPASQLSAEDLADLGYHEAVPLTREPYRTYETEWVLDGLVYREEIVSEDWAEGALTALRVLKQSEIRDVAEAALAPLKAEYGATEIATWDQQYAEAQAVTADSGAEVPLLTAIAQARGQSVADLAARVIANRAAWVAVSGHVVGQRLAYQDRLDAAATPEEVQAIEVAYSLPEAP